MTARLQVLIHQAAKTMHVKDVKILHPGQPLVPSSAHYIVLQLDTPGLELDGSDTRLRPVAAHIVAL